MCVCVDVGANVQRESGVIKTKAVILQKIVKQLFMMYKTCYQFAVTPLRL